MGDYTGENIFEKIGAFIPGYKGYSEKEDRRDTDKLMRTEIAKSLDKSKENIETVISQIISDKDTVLINEIDRIRKKLDLVANQIRYASYGESGFFDVVQVDISDLDRIYQFDLEVKEKAEKLVNMLNALRTSGNLKNDCKYVINLLSILIEKVADRDKLIMEVR